MAKSILVTGGAGFIGSHLVDSLLTDGHRITVIDNFNDFYNSAIKRNNIASHLEKTNYNLIEADIRDKSAIDEIFSSNKFDEIIHLAAMAGVRPSIKNPSLYQEVNVSGTLNLLEGCRQSRVNKFIFASSSSVYGNGSIIPFSETGDVNRPISPYAATKLAGELLAYTYHHLFNLSAVCLRLFTVYGPRQRPEMAIHLFTDRIYCNEEIMMFGNGESSRDYTYVDDIISGILKCREQNFDYEIINLGNSKPIILRDLLSTIETAMNTKAKVVKLPDQPGDVRRTCADISKAKNILGYQPRVNIDRGIQNFVNWYMGEKQAQ
jgi:UDP-glucuronate 4-epimerase